MDSYQNLVLLENLYRLQALGYRYVDPITPNLQHDSSTLPDSMAMLQETIRQCYLCDLSKSRRQSMSGYGNPQADLMFIDAYVSAAEDETNGYYTGRSGTMLRDMIEKVLMLSVEEVFITHAVKCKPFGFQNPSESEAGTCTPYLAKQIEIVQPKVIVPLGADAYSMLTGDRNQFERLRGEIIPHGSAVIVPMHNPLHLVRNPSDKKTALRDLQTIKGQLK